MKKIWIVLLALLLVIGVVFIVFMLNKAEETEQEQLAGLVNVAGKTVSVEVTPTPEAAEESTQTSLQDVINILLLGVDNNNANTMDELGNSDGIILVSLNPKTKEIIFTSFLRDTRVRVNDSYNDKLTMVYHTGGTELLKKTFEDNFGIPVDYYAMFNYLDVIDIVDSVGGVEIELSQSELYNMEDKIINLTGLTNTDYADNTLANAQPGKINLSGLQAAAYMRIRPAEGNYDFGRTERARKVISEVIGKLYSLSIPDMLHFAQVMFEKTKTDIPAELMLKLSMDAENIRGYKRVMDRIPIDGAYESINDGSGAYIVPDFEINNRHLRESIYEGIH